MSEKLGSASTDITKGAAALVILLLLISVSERFSITVRVVVGLCVFFVFVAWYFERYTFFENHISILRLSNIFRPIMNVSSSSVRSIKFYKHLDMATGTIVYIHFNSSNDNDDLIAFNFRKKHLFILKFAKINRICVDFGGILWIERAYEGLSSPPALPPVFPAT